MPPLAPLTVRPSTQTALQFRVVKAPGLVPPPLPQDPTKLRIPAPAPLLVEQRAAQQAPPHRDPLLASPRLLQLLGFTMQFLKFME